MTMKLNRRIFLRGLGGAVVAAPFLSSVAERAARAQGTPAEDPRRLFIMFTHYGCITNSWFPAPSHGALTPELLQPTSLKSLAPYASKILLPRGIRAMNQWGPRPTYGQINDPHTQVVGSYFSCHPVTPNGVVEPGQFLPSNEAKFNAKPTGRTLDHIAAEQVSPTKTPLVMRIGNRNDSPQSAISYSAPQEAFPGVGAPLQVFNQLTMLFQDGGPMNPDTYRTARGKQVLDLVRHDLMSLEAQVMSAADKKKLSDWKDLLVDMTNVVRAECNQATADSLGIKTNTATQDITAGITEVMMNLGVLAAICDANRVFVFKFPPGYTFTGLGISQEHHNLSHRQNDALQGGGTCLAGVNDMLKKIDTWHAEQFAYLVGQLDKFNEGAGTVLDNSAVCYFQELSDGNSHNLNNMPIVQAGSCGGYFKTGQIINVWDGSADMSNGKSEAACSSGGTEMNPTTNGDHPTGTDQKVANAPINKYFCNLLNAIGVKAGADGWPAENGTQPVEKFGKYDDTGLFGDGGTAPPTIKDPGEFAELKANG
jgi:hypothetical protein